MSDQFSRKKTTNKIDLSLEDLSTGSGQGGGREQASPACAAWVALLPDAAEGLLSEAEQQGLDRHIVSCAGCAWELADAQRGAAWLALLKGHAPEPPLDLLSSILQRTSEAESLTRTVPATLAGVPQVEPALAGGVGYPGFVGTSAGLGAPVPAWTLATPAQRRPGTLSRLWTRMEHWLGLGGGAFGASLQPRLAMTSAMAFFSICLTLNLLGVPVRNLHAESLRPAGLQRTVADTSASLVRSFEGIRMVYRVESRVNQWRTASINRGDSPLGDGH